jgi:glycolate oxidase iron-sulfur subunit
LRNAGPRIGYWVSCGYNYFLPEAGLATVAVLADRGAEVVVLDNACCGLPAWVYGDTPAARRLALRNLERIGAAADCDYIVSDCASCASHLKEYEALLGDDRKHGEMASQLSSRVRSLSELLAAQADGRSLAVDAGPPPAGAAIVTYHEPCHLGARYQDIVREPRDLIRSIPGLRYVEMAESDSCCGAAGSYGIVNRGVSMRVLERKVDHIAKTGAAVVVTECPACMMQIEVGLRRRNLAVRVWNLSQLLEYALPSRAMRQRSSGVCPQQDLEGPEWKTSH